MNPVRTTSSGWDIKSRSIHQSWLQLHLFGPYNPGLTPSTDQRLNSRTVKNWQCLKTLPHASIRCAGGS